MPLLSTEIPLEAHVKEVLVANADGDAAKELIVVLSAPAGTAPEKVTLLVLHFTAAGALEKKERYILGNRALTWDADGGLWAIDKDGLLRLVPDAEPVRLAKLSTPLAALGPTTPIRSQFAHDLDGDGRPELLVYAAGKIHGFKADGTPIGSVDAAPEGALNPLHRAGGSALEMRLQPPPLAIGDLDGDGKKDLVLAAGASATLYYTGAALGEGSALGAVLGQRRATIRLPLDLEPRDVPMKAGETRREIAEIWLRDADGDGKLDLSLYRWVIEGSFFGATAEVLFCKGTGSSFLPPVTFQTEVAAFGMKPQDVDQDGDLDLVAPLVDVGVGNLARALVAQEVQVDLSVFPMAGGKWMTKPTILRQLPYPLSIPDRLQVQLEADFNGDGRLDLLTNDAGDRVLVFPWTNGAISSTALYDQAIVVPSGDGTVLAAELTGDKRAEVVVWGPDVAKLTVLRAP